jgi:hypothetical protein
VLLHLLDRLLGRRGRLKLRLGALRCLDLLRKARDLLLQIRDGCCHGMQKGGSGSESLALLRNNLFANPTRSAVLPNGVS